MKKKAAAKQIKTLIARLDHSIERRSKVLADQKKARAKLKRKLKAIMPEYRSEKPQLPDTLVTIDFEASGLGIGTYPIEVGIVMASREGEPKEFSTLIKPTSDWLTRGRWKHEAESIHKISRHELASGMPVDEVCRRLNELLAGHIVFADGGSHDTYWLARLFTGRSISFRLAKADEIPWSALWGHIEAQREIGIAHRALEDARWLHRTLRQIEAAA